MRLRRRFTRPRDKRPRWRRHGPIAGPLARRVSAKTTALGAKIRLVGTQGSLGARLLPPGELSRACANRLRLVSANDLAGRRRSRCGPPCPPSPPKSRTFPDRSRSAAARPARIFLFSAFDTASNPLRSMRPREIHGDGVGSPLLRTDGVSLWLSSTQQSNHALPATMACAAKPPRALPQCVLRPQAGAGGSVGVKFCQDGAPRWGGKPHSGQGSRRGRRGALGYQGYGQKAASIEH
jgi:hypothetical protein